MTPLAVRCQGLEVRAGGRRVLGPLDLAIAEEEHVLLVGRSGSGKTTLLRALAGLAAPSAGRIELYGETASDGRKLALPPQRRGVGFLFQGGALWPHMSVRRTIDFVLSLAGLSRQERSARRSEVLEWVELSGYEERMPATLSGGEAQRLALARALAARPRLLLLDEPLGPLDQELRGALLARLADLHERLSLTVVHVTHDPFEARSLATRTLRLSNGVLQDGARGAGEEGEA